MSTDFVNIYAMKLHEVKAITPISFEGCAFTYYTVMRVPGGWIYQVWDTEKQDHTREVFVPYNDEFRNYSYSISPPKE